MYVSYTSEHTHTHSLAKHSTLYTTFHEATTTIPLLRSLPQQCRPLAPSPSPSPKAPSIGWLCTVHSCTICVLCRAQCARINIYISMCTLYNDTQYIIISWQTRGVEHEGELCMFMSFQRIGNFKFGLHPVPTHCNLCHVYFVHVLCVFMFGITLHTIYNIVPLNNCKKKKKRNVCVSTNT